MSCAQRENVRLRMKAGGQDYYVDARHYGNSSRAMNRVLYCDWVVCFSEGYKVEGGLTYEQIWTKNVHTSRPAADQG